MLWIKQQKQAFSLTYTWFGIVFVNNQCLNFAVSDFHQYNTTALKLGRCYLRTAGCLKKSVFKQSCRNITFDHPEKLITIKNLSPKVINQALPLCLSSTRWLFLSHAQLNCLSINKRKMNSNACGCAIKLYYGQTNWIIDRIYTCTQLNSLYAHLRSKLHYHRWKNHFKNIQNNWKKNL